MLSVKFFNEPFFAKTLIVFVGMFFFISKSFPQLGSVEGEWVSYASDAGSTKYTSLSEINRENFDKLEIAWAWTSWRKERAFGAPMRHADPRRRGGRCVIDSP